MHGTGPVAQGDYLSVRLRPGSAAPLRIAAGLGLLLLASTTVAAVISDFETGSEGWDVIDLVGLGDYKTVLGTYGVSWAGTGGNPNGHVWAFDPSAGAFFFRAPAPYLGNQSQAIGQVLTFDLFTTENTYADDSVVVLVGGASSRIMVTSIAQPPVNAWQRYSVTLQSSDFRLNNARGPIVLPDEFADVMGDLKAIYLPAEFATGLVETSRLDNVTLFPEPTLPGLIAALVTLARRRA